MGSIFDLCLWYFRWISMNNYKVWRFDFYCCWLLLSGATAPTTLAAPMNPLLWLGGRSYSQEYSYRAGLGRGCPFLWRFVDSCRAIDVICFSCMCVRLRKLSPYLQWANTESELHWCKSFFAPAMLHLQSDLQTYEDHC